MGCIGIFFLIILRLGNGNAIVFELKLHYCYLKIHFCTNAVP